MKPSDKGNLEETLLMKGGVKVMLTNNTNVADSLKMKGMIW